MGCDFRGTVEYPAKRCGPRLLARDVFTCPLQVLFTCTLVESTVDQPLGDRSETFHSLLPPPRRGHRSAIRGWRAAYETTQVAGFGDLVHRT